MQSLGYYKYRQNQYVVQPPFKALLSPVAQRFLMWFHHTELQCVSFACVVI